jgi:hypothetical protein
VIAASATRRHVVVLAALAIATSACHRPISGGRASSTPVCGAPSPIGFYVDGSYDVGGAWWPAGDDGGGSYGPYDDGSYDDGTYGDPPPEDPPPEDPPPEEDPPADDGDPADDSDPQTLQPRLYGACFTCSIVCSVDDGARTIGTTSESASSTAAACRDAQARLADYATHALAGSLLSCARPAGTLTPATPTVR